MSTPPPRDPEDPTRPLGPPAEVPPPAPRVREREYEEVAEDPLWREELLDKVRSLQTAVALLGLLSVIALGVAAYALLTKEEESDTRSGASSERVNDLDERIDELESDVEDAPSSGSVSNVRDDQKALEERIEKLEARPRASAQDDGPSEQDVQDVQSSVDQIGQDLEDLDGRVEELEQQQSENP
jgi:peptidoglycan hydrolase CwlO-like protein